MHLSVKGVPLAVIDAKSPDENIADWEYQCSSYCLELNKLYDYNPVSLFVLTNDLKTAVYKWDQKTELNMQTIFKFKELYAYINIEKRLFRIVLLGLLISTFFWTLDVTGPYWLSHRPAVRHIPFIGAYKLPLESALRNGILLILYITLAGSILLFVAFLLECNACLIRMKIDKIETFKYQLAALLVAYVVIFLVALPQLFALMLLKPFGLTVSG